MDETYESSVWLRLASLSDNSENHAVDLSTADGATTPERSSIKANHSTSSHGQVTSSTIGASSVKFLEELIRAAKSVPQAGSSRDRPCEGVASTADWNRISGLSYIGSAVSTTDRTAQHGVDTESLHGRLRLGACAHEGNREMIHSASKSTATASSIGDETRYRHIYAFIFYRCYA